MARLARSEAVSAIGQGVPALRPEPGPALVPVALSARRSAFRLGADAVRADQPGLLCARLLGLPPRLRALRGGEPGGGAAVPRRDHRRPAHLQILARALDDDHVRGLYLAGLCRGGRHDVRRAAPALAARRPAGRDRAGPPGGRGGGRGDRRLRAVAPGADRAALAGSRPGDRRRRGGVPSLCRALSRHLWLAPHRLYAALGRLWLRVRRSRLEGEHIAGPGCSPARRA